MKKFLKSVSVFLKANSLTILALTISLMTLWIYVRQTDVLIQQTKASSWPYLKITMNKSHNSTNFNQKTLERLRISIENKGNGPAIIEGAVLKMDGVEFRNWNDFYSYLQVPDSIKRHGNSPLYQTVIMPGESYLLIDWSDNLTLARFIYERMKDLEMSVCYSSTFGDYWTVTRKGFYSNLEKSDRVQSDKCELKAKIYFVE